jgi:hypothetical protein
MADRSSKPKRPRDVSQRAKLIVDIATRENSAARRQKSEKTKKLRDGGKRVKPHQED